MTLIPQLILVTAPTVEPVSVADMKVQLGMGTISDEALGEELTQQLEGHLIAARIACEDYEKRAYGLQTWRAEYDRFPRHAHEYDHRGRPSIRLPKPPLNSITSFQYVDTTGGLVDLPPDTSYGSNPALPAYAYQVQQGNETQRCRISPAADRSWPLVRHGVDGAVQITFQCGFAQAPANVKQAIKLLAQFYYEQGGSMDMAIPRQILNLLSTPTKGT